MPNIYPAINNIDTYLKKSRQDYFKYIKCINNYDVNLKDFIRKISIINLSKYLNANQELSIYKYDTDIHTKFIQWHNNGKKKKVEIENNYKIYDDKIRIYSLVEWDENGNIISNYLTKIINDNVDDILVISV